MECSAEIACPWCGEISDLVLDTSQPVQQLITDCEVCCRPFEILVSCEPGEILGLEVRGA